MALALLQSNVAKGESDEQFEIEEVMQFIPKTNVTTLNPMNFDDKEYVFLDDLANSLGCREDEALSIPFNTCSMEDEIDPPGQVPKLEIDKSNRI